jgi:hypothetical protein
MATPESTNVGRLVAVLSNLTNSEVQASDSLVVKVANGIANAKLEEFSSRASVPPTNEQKAVFALAVIKYQIRELVKLGVEQESRRQITPADYEI